MFELDNGHFVSQQAQMPTPTPTNFGVSYETWLAALASSACIGCTSLVPWLFNLTFFEQRKEQRRQQPEKQSELNDAHEKQLAGDDSRMKLLLSFAVGAILGDIFFHLIPESIHSHSSELNLKQQLASRRVGLSIIGGIFMFIIVEVVLEKWSRSIKSPSGEGCGEPGESESKSAIFGLSEQSELNINNKDLKPLETSAQEIDNNNNSGTQLLSNQNEGMFFRKSKKFSNSDLNNNDDGYEPSLKDVPLKDESRKPVESNRDLARPEGEELATVDVAGYLSLIANGFDNFTHGLAIGASFLVGFKVGILTTFIIFIHEIPHEICDYAILVNSGFSRWEAVKAQSSVSLFGTLGTALALYVKSLETLQAKTLWILPFSAGGFLYIALVNLLPEILEGSKSYLDSFKQITCLLLGVTLMAIVAIV